MSDTNDRTTNNLNSSAQPLTRRKALVAASVGFAGLTAASLASLARTPEDVSHNSEAIHQEIIFKATRQRVYETLTETKLFDKVVQLSAAAKSGMPAAPPTQISREVGGTFTIFAGHIFGRHLELVPNERLVQAWRVVDWPAGFFSSARFVLDDQGSGTKLIFDHIGFPEGLGVHLAEGWNINYWQPMQKSLA